MALDDDGFVVATGDAVDGQRRRRDRSAVRRVRRGVRVGTRAADRRRAATSTCRAPTRCSSRSGSTPLPMLNPEKVDRSWAGKGPGESAKYQHYETADGKFVLFCAIEPKFWNHWCTAVDRDDLLASTGRPRRRLRRRRRRAASRDPAGLPHEDAGRMDEDGGRRRHRDGTGAALRRSRRRSAPPGAGQVVIEHHPSSVTSARSGTRSSSPARSSPCGRPPRSVSTPTRCSTSSATTHRPAPTSTTSAWCSPPITKGTRCATTRSSPPTRTSRCRPTSGDRTSTRSSRVRTHGGEATRWRRRLAHAGQEQPVPLGLNFSAGRGWEKLKTSGLSYADGLVGAGDAKQRLAGDGRRRRRRRDPVPGGLRATHARHRRHPTGGLRRVSRGYNDWLSQEYTAEDPDRLLGLAILPCSTIDDSIAELERVATMPGIRGVVLHQWPNGSGIPVPDDDDRFWHARSSSTSRSPRT